MAGIRVEEELASHKLSIMDIFSPEKRTAIMASIRSRRNRSTEMKMVTLLKKASITGWRRHLPLPGCPDFAFRKQKIAVFVDGDFWHGNPKTFRAPKTRTEFWSQKIARNIERDILNAKALELRGWRVLRIWESDLKKTPIACVARIIQALAESPRRQEEIDL